MELSIEKMSLKQKLEQNRHGAIVTIILLIGCFGGIAVGFRAVESVLALILVIIPTMTTLSLLLAVAPMKWIYNSAILCISIDLLIILYYLLIA